MSEHEEHGKGFKVTDRRSFTREGEPIERTEAEPEKFPEELDGLKSGPAARSPEVGAAESRRRSEPSHLEGRFLDLLSLLATQASLALGAPHPATGQVRLQRVAGQGTADFTIFLATPVTSEQICATAGLHTAGYSSCRITGKVVINLARWLTGVPDYGAPVEDYQRYVVNHEVGHSLGHGHAFCAGRGKVAPVMMQQTYGLGGCVAWPWTSPKPA